MGAVFGAARNAGEAAGRSAIDDKTEFTEPLAYRAVAHAEHAVPGQHSYTEYSTLLSITDSNPLRFTLKFGHQHDAGDVDEGVPDYTEIQFTGKALWLDGRSEHFELNASHVVWQRESGRSFEACEAVFTCQRVINPQAQGGTHNMCVLLLFPDGLPVDLSPYPRKLLQYLQPGQE